MRFTISTRAVFSRSLAAVALTAALAMGSSSTLAQTPAPAPQPTPAPAPAPTPTPAPGPAPTATAPPGVAFTGDAGIIYYIIKPDKTADFEMVLGRLKEAMQKSEDAVKKQQAASWKVYKMIEPGPNGNVLYVFLADPAVKGADYTMTKLMGELMPTEAQALYDKIKDAFVSRNIANLSMVMNFGQ